MKLILILIFGICAYPSNCAPRKGTLNDIGNAWKKLALNTYDEIVAPINMKPSTDVSLTGTKKFEAPETEAPETEAPETEAPETEAPETEAPETEAPETEAPETEAPETEAPETEAPETEAPETEAPETEAPETEAPETEAPETEAPITEAPETEAPETEAPQTEAPKTEAPETEAPVTEIPETEQPVLTERPELEYVEVGCFKDSHTGVRALPLLIGNYRDEINWFNLNLTIRRCAKAAAALGYRFFAVQFYGECWSGPLRTETYNLYGRSKNCWKGVGKHWTNFVYKFW